MEFSTRKPNRLKVELSVWLGTYKDRLGNRYEAWVPGDGLAHFRRKEEPNENLTLPQDVFFCLFEEV